MTRPLRSSRWTRRKRSTSWGPVQPVLSPAVVANPDSASSAADVLGSPDAAAPVTVVAHHPYDTGRHLAWEIDGVTLFHEHLSIKLSEEMDATDDVDTIVREIQTASGKGSVASLTAVIPMAAPSGMCSASLVSRVRPCHTISPGWSRQAWSNSVATAGFCTAFPSSMPSTKPSST